MYTYVYTSTTFPLDTHWELRLTYTKDGSEWNDPSVRGDAAGLRPSTGGQHAPPKHKVLLFLAYIITASPLRLHMSLIMMLLDIVLIS